MDPGLRCNANRELDNVIVSQINCQNTFIGFRTTSLSPNNLSPSATRGLSSVNYVLLAQTFGTTLICRNLP